MACKPLTSDLLKDGRKVGVNRIKAYCVGDLAGGFSFLL